MKCDVYLSFDGNCEEAIDFYKDVFDGEYQVMMRYKDGPPEYSKPEIENKIMHATLSFGNGCELKASDNFFKPINKGNNYHVSIAADDEEQGYAIFSSLMEDGEVTMPYNDVFWGGKFGSGVDKFGIQWMISSPH
ncbi:VOC family protein [Winogradskyella ouciana]|uniref:VOC family protein n=1 Tax=Winogradskyella ouciana TaxID=2608631 RepID=A0A7K1GDZ1_9FLAO|nr:VOC family protein [Winogradskyella ouciana]MTE27516.1 VOC family protein [Winogradskyella ouciana]